MSTLGKFLVTILFVGILLWVAVANRMPVDVSLPPFFESLSVPVALIMMGCVILGFMWGAAIVWLNGATTRSQVRLQRREIKTLEQEVSKKEQSL